MRSEMNFSQLHERLRTELLRRIEREVLTATLLARKTGMQQPHISNFLRNRRRLSIPALDRVLAALDLSVADLLGAPAPSTPAATGGIPLVSQYVAMYEDRISTASATERIQLPPSTLTSLRAEHGARRPTRERFVAVGLTPAQARIMEPVLQPNAILILDRHSTLPSSSVPSARAIYAVPFNNELHFSYVAYDNNSLVLRPYSPSLPVHILPVPPQLSPAQLITGRVCVAIAYL
jgi:transcriptional regulator with XRE-family HTH domain